MKDWLKINFYQDRKIALEERNKIQALISQQKYPEHFHLPLTLQFELTSHCNLHCKHCYNNSGADNRKEDYMTVEKWKEFAHYLVEKGGLFQCVLSGGEPLLLENDLFDIMDILHDDGTSFLVISNGWLMDQEKAKRFSKYRYKWFQISIDGAIAQKHDSFRERDGSWEHATNAVTMLSNEGIPVAVAHSITPNTLEDIEDMCELAYCLGATTILVGEVTPSGRSALNTNLVLDHEQKNYLRGKIVELQEKYAGRLLVQRSSTVKNQLLRYVDTPNNGAIIRPNGDIRLDCMAPFIIGSLSRDDFQSVWTEKADVVWKDPRVQKYIESYADFDDFNSFMKNYYDADIYL